VGSRTTPSPQAPTAAAWNAAAAAVVPGAFVLWVASLQTWSFEDDAFIFFHYAENLVHHGALEFNLGERIEGFSSPLWTAVLAATTALGVPPTRAAFQLATFLVLAVVLRSARDAEQDGLRGPFVWLAPLALSVHEGFAHTAVSGMDTAVFTAALWGGISAVRSALRAGAQPGIGASCAFGLAALARPEGVLALVAFGTGHAWRARRGGTAWPRAVRDAARWLLPAVAMLMFLLLSRLLYYGEWLPNPAWAKRGGTIGHWRVGIAWIGAFLASAPLAWGVLARFASRGDGSFTRGAGPEILAFVALATVAIAHVGGGGDTQFRLLVPLLPALYALAASGLALATYTRVRHPRRAALVGLAILIAVAAAGFRPAHLRRGEERDWVVGASKLGRELDRRLSPDAVIAAAAIGAVAYHSRRAIRDLLGLTDRGLARRGLGVPSAVLERSDVGHDRFDVAWSMRTRPDVVVFMRGYANTAFADLAEVPATTQVERKLVAYLVEHSEYRLHNVRVDEAAYWAVFVRDGVSFVPDGRALNARP
jgi:hypothetical protein